MGQSSSKHPDLESYKDRIKFLNDIVEIPSTLVEIILQYNFGYRDTILARISSRHLQLISTIMGKMTQYLSLHIQQFPAEYNIWLFHPYLILAYNQYGKVIKEIKLDRGRYFSSYQYIGFAVVESYYLLLNAEKKQVEIYNCSDESLFRIVKNDNIEYLSKLRVTEEMIFFYICNLKYGDLEEYSIHDKNIPKVSINLASDDYVYSKNCMINKFTSQGRFEVTNDNGIQAIKIEDHWWTGNFTVDYKNMHLYHVNRKGGNGEVIDMFDIKTANKISTFGNKQFLTTIGGSAATYDDVQECLWIFNYEYGIISCIQGTTFPFTLRENYVPLNSPLIETNIFC